MKKDIEQLEPIAEKIFWAIQKHGEETGKYEVLEDMFRYDYEFSKKQEEFGVPMIVVEVSWEEKEGEGNATICVFGHGITKNYSCFREASEKGFIINNEHSTYKEMLVIANRVFNQNSKSNDFENFYDRKS